MHEYAQDAVTYVQNYGTPDLFITFTCNPKWTEIERELEPGQNPQDRHDIITRVFQQKLKVMIDVLTKYQVFGDTRCNDIILAEIPDPVTDSHQHDILTTQMLHRPCNAFNPLSPCMADEKCTKRYLRPLVAKTVTGNHGYPVYRWRSKEDNGRTIKVKVQNQEVEIGNKFIVPYCPLLSRIFETYANVKSCHSAKLIKYLCKYVTKGSDMAVFGIASKNANDKIIVYLAVHLENSQRVYFTKANAAQRAERPLSITLTSFFAIGEADPFAATLIYVEMPKHYTWNQSTKKFQRRKQGSTVPDWPQVFSTDALGRMYTVHPRNDECFHLRLLLLWNKYKDDICEDILHRLRNQTNNPDIQITDEIYNERLILIKDQCLTTANMLLIKVAMIAPNRSMRDAFNQELNRELRYNVDTLQEFVQNKVPLLNEQQKQVYETFMQAVDNNTGGVFLLDAPGGTGKTFVISLILATIRSRCDIALAVGSSGIAATLLGGGRTAHSALKLTLNLNTINTLTCNISRSTAMGKLLMQCKLIVWDECTMAHNKSLEALNFTLKDLRRNNNILGGLMILLAGHFRQTLPVIPHGTLTDKLNACLKASPLWNNCGKAAEEVTADCSHAEAMQLREDCVALHEEFKREHALIENACPAVLLRNEYFSQSSSGAAQQAYLSHTQRGKLPEIKLPQFSGNYTEWLAELIKELPLTAEFFKIAWDALLERYGKKRLVLAQLLQAKRRIPPMRVGSVGSLMDLAMESRKLRRLISGLGSTQEVLNALFVDELL
ncbi:uncharacterized protein LOC106644785 [Copidosoma floridanum]|uniref:uncharacterized protein LOC106644785 n=1 Tax=Copidosoma floridanum TaxID=29053 RepID=UPI000C6F8C3F|nr:uncharacterized protein LOC106644785 [Copidosoma floridanum]